MSVGRNLRSRGRTRERFASARPDSRIPAFVFLLTLLAGACGGDAGSVSHSADLASLLTSDPGVTRFQGGTDATAPFDTIQDADITPDGEHVVVLDRVAPWVHVLRRDGTERASFFDNAERGAYAVRPYALAARDSQVLVLDAGLQLFDLDGAVITSVPRPNMLPLEAVIGCNDEWVTYGYGGKGGLPGRDEEWIQRIALDSTGIVARNRVLADSSPPGRFPFGRLYNIASANGEFIALHEHGQPPQLVRWSCTRQRPEPASENAVIRPQGSIRSNIPYVSIQPDDAVPAGMALLEDGLLITAVSAESSSDGAAVRTVFQLITRDSVFMSAVSGDYRARGARYAREVLLITNQPAPTVLIVPESALVNVLRESATVRSRRGK